MSAKSESQTESQSTTVAAKPGSPYVFFFHGDEDQPCVGIAEREFFKQSQMLDENEPDIRGFLPEGFYTAAESCWYFRGTEAKARALLLELGFEEVANPWV
jgi:hypothetical protein